MRVIVLLVLPFGIIYCPGVGEWLGRLFVVSLLFLGILAGCFGSSLNPRARYVRGGKLARPGMEHERRIAERICRGLAFAFGVFFTFQVAVPFGSDCAELVQRRQPMTITGTAIRSHAIPLLEQSVNLMRSGVSELRSWTMFFWIHPIHQGWDYQLAVLPRSRIILASDPLGVVER